MKPSDEVRVKTVIANQLRKSVEQLENHKKLKDDLGADSLDAVSVFLALEDEFNVEISDDMAKTVVTVQDAIDLYARVSQDRK